MKSEIKEFEATASTTVECVVYSSTYHVEISPSETDRYCFFWKLQGNSSLNSLIFIRKANITEQF